MALKQVIDVSGSSAASKVLLDLLNTFPGLGNDRIAFSYLDSKGGIAFWPTSGAVIISNRESITGHVRQECAYPIVIIFRLAAMKESTRLQVKEFLDLLGSWISGQSVTIGGDEYKLTEYPDLGGNRKIRNISVTNAAHVQSAYTDGIEDWAINLQMRYTNEFEKET